MKLRKLTSFLCAAALTVSSIAGLSVSVSADEAAKNVTVAVNVGDTTAKVTSGETEELSGVLIHAKYTENVLQSVKVSSEFTTPQNSVDIGFAYAEGDKLFVWNSLTGMEPYNVTIEPKTVAPTVVNTVAGVTITSDGNYPAELTATVAAINDSGFTDTTAFTYTWSKDGGTVSGGTDGTLADAAAGSYTVTATYNGTGNYTGSITSTPVAVSTPDDTREDIASLVRTQIDYTDVPEPATLTALVDNGATGLEDSDFIFTWYKDGTPIPDANTKILEDADAGSYTVIVTVKPDNASYKGSSDQSNAAVVKNVYTITWVVAEGAQFTTKVTVGDTPRETSAISLAISKAGDANETDTDTYTFTGWSPAITAATADTTYTAQFRSQKKSYTVTYNKNEGTIANESNYTSYTCGTALTLPTPARSGYTFGGWYEASDFSGDAVTTIGTDAYGDKVYYARWTPNTADTYTVTFDSNGGTAVASQQVENEQTASEPTAPTREHYTFVEWQLDGTTYDFDTPVTDDITLIAAWEIDKVTVSFDAGTGADAFTQQDASRQVNYNEAVGSVPTLQNIKANYAFAHWLSGQTQYSNDEVAALAVTQPLSFLAKYTITVTLDGNGGTFNSDATKAVSKLEGTAFGAADEPERAHYTFNGWKKGGEDVNDITTEVITAPVTYTAQWTHIERTVTFDLNGGEVDNSDENVDVKVNDGEKVTPPSVSRDGYTLKGWKKDNADFDLNTEITEDITLVADWEAIPVGSYSVSFELNGATGSVAAQTVTEGETATEPASAPTREGYDFDGWLLNGTAYDFTTPVTSNITLVAKWDIKQYTITWLNDDGSEIDTTQVEYGEVPTHTDAEKNATAQYTYTFAGWSETSATDEAGATKSLPTATKTTTYYAVFKQTTNTYTITWLNDDDTQIDTTEVAYGEVPTHAAPSKTNPNNNGYNYTFTGWDTTPVAVTGTATYKATFSANAKTFDITYNINGHGTASTEKLTYTYAAGLTELPELTETGYTFNGWYTAAEDGNKVESITAEEYGDKELYAQWTPIEYNITFNGTDGATGMDDAPEKYTIETDDITLPTPEKEGFTFAGWYEKEAPEESDEAVTTIEKGTTGDKTFYAQWTEEKEYVVGAVDEANEALYKWTFNNVASGDITSSTSDDARKFNDKTTDKSSYAELTVSLGNGDSMEGGVIKIANSSVREINDTAGYASLADTNSKRYLIVKPYVDGDFSITLTAGNSTNRVYYKEFTGEADISQCQKDGDGKILEVGNAGGSGTIRMTEGKTYVVYYYTYNSSGTVSDISFIASDKVITGEFDAEHSAYNWNIGTVGAASVKGLAYTDTNDYATLSVHLGAGDSMDGTKINCVSPSVGETNSTNGTVDVTSRYMIVEPKVNGVFNVTIAFANVDNSYVGRIYYADVTGEESLNLTKYKKEDPNAGNVTAANTATSMGIKMQAGHKYIVFYYRNQTRTGACEISKLSYDVTDNVITTSYATGAFTWSIGATNTTTVKGVPYKATAAEGVEEDKNVDLTVYLGANDSMDGEKINYSVTSVGEPSGSGQKYTSLAVNEQYILVQPKVTGIFNVGVSFDGSLSSGAPGRIYYQDITEDLKTANEAGTSLTLSNYKKAEPAVVAGAVNSQGTTENIISIPMEAGKAYIVFTYQTKTPTCRIHSLTYNVPDQAITGAYSEGVSTWTVGNAEKTSITGVKYSAAITDETNGVALDVALGSGDTMSDGKIVWSNASVKEPNTTGYQTVDDTKRYLLVTPKQNGTLAINAKNSGDGRFYYAAVDDPANIALTNYNKADSTATNVAIPNSGTPTNGDWGTFAKFNNTTATRYISMTGGTTYIIYMYNATTTINSLTYTNAPE